jgi:hypothetical protein
VAFAAYRDFSVDGSGDGEVSVPHEAHEVPDVSRSALPVA